MFEKRLFKTNLRDLKNHFSLDKNFTVTCGVRKRNSFKKYCMCCGKEFPVKGRSNLRLVFCSRECKNKHRKRVMLLFS